MKEIDATTKLVLVIGTIICAMAVAAAMLISPPHAHAAPGSDCDLYDSRLCGDWGKVTYCPSTGNYVSVLTPCPSLITGPYAPGGLEPDDE